MKRTRRICALGMAGIMAFSMAACGSKDGGNGGNGDGSPKGGDGGVASASADLPAIDTIKLGEDYTDLTAEIKVLTQRTDLIDTTFAQYKTRFIEMYPNITINYEGVTDYAESITMRLTTDDWGDICMIPTTMDKAELPDHFISFGAGRGADHRGFRRIHYPGEPGLGAGAFLWGAGASVVAGGFPQGVLPLCECRDRGDGFPFWGSKA